MFKATVGADSRSQVEQFASYWKTISHKEEFDKARNAAGIVGLTRSQISWRIQSINVQRITPVKALR